MTYAIPDDVAVQLGRPIDSVTATERAQWQAWLDKVERSIRRAFKKAGFELDEQINAGEVSPADVGDVEVAAVIRKIDNPKWGETSYTKSVDDASVTTRREGAGESDPLALLDVELGDLIPRRQSGAFSTRPGFQSDRCWL